MKHNFFKTILLLTGMMAVSCVKNEPLDIEGDYKKGIQERATEREAKEKEAQEKADEESKKVLGRRKTFYLYVLVWLGSCRRA